MIRQTLNCFKYLPQNLQIAKLSNIKCTKYSIVEGDYKQFRFRKIVPEDYDKVCEHMAEYFLRGEPTSQLLGWSQNFADDMNLLVRMVLPHNMSFLAEDRKSGDIAGIGVTFHHTKDLSFDHLDIKTLGAKLTFKLFEEIATSSGVSTKYGIDNWVELLAASTNPKYQNQGLTGEFCARLFEFLKAEGFKHVLTIVTSRYAEAVTKKNGFKEEARINYDEFLDFEGKPAFDPNLVTQDHFAQCMLKTL